jgi:hypothetical protein
MLKYLVSIISKSWGIILLIVIALLAYYFSQVKAKNEVKVDYLGELRDLSEVLNEAWLKGSAPELPRENFQCDLINLADKLYHSDFLHCNPTYIDCLTSSVGIIKIGKKKYKKLDFYMDEKQSPILTYMIGKEKFSIKLIDTCKDTYLPSGKYSAGVKGKDNLWDNIDQIVYIDKNYRTNLDVSYWNQNIEKPIYAPSTNLTHKEMERYCNSIGRQLLQARFLDAASFFPSNDAYFFKHRYHFSKRARIEIEKVSTTDCGNLYTKECESVKPYLFQEPVALSWMGLHNVLGNYPEVVTNKFYPNQNLSESSFFYNWDSEVHQIGLRVDWSAKQEVKGAFRCMVTF